MTDVASAPGINQEDVKRLRARIGQVLPIDDPFIRYINRDSALHAARSVGDINPLHTDPAYAALTHYGRLVGPPYMLYGVHWGAWDFRRGEGLPGVHALHSGDTWYYHAPLLEGDEIYATKCLIGLDPFEGRWAGEQYLQTREVVFFNQRDERVATLHMQSIRGKRSAAKERGKYSGVKAATYTREQLAEIDAKLDCEYVRGSDDLTGESVTVGDALPTMVRGPLSQNDMLAWRMAVGGGHIRTGKYWLDYRRRTPGAAPVDPETGIPESVARVHWDPAFARSIGMPAPYDLGSQRGGWAINYVTNWAGDNARIVSVGVQYRAMNFVGDVTSFDGRVTAVSESQNATIVDIEFAGVNQRGDANLQGRARIELPLATGKQGDG